jgi:hypothetical protein
VGNGVIAALPARIRDYQSIVRLRVPTCGAHPATARGYCAFGACGGARKNRYLFRGKVAWKREVTYVTKRIPWFLGPCAIHP